ncbi:hypothetical protein D9619_000244 [Psilocybe cf. subviscida]|uniref:Putative lipoate-protein ligase A n=1 Tax=Psilocybe cf. subviscida TaxID=2480587 RepID=A0A8H5F3N6_9AGAR|nr:hypothetical protein D9619_000244 [Psilocybe cf. subviscida]
MGIDARLNDRNDVCVGPDKVSGSAYKIVNKRAYHHGTMLISTQLQTLGDVLRPQENNIVTKGVSSVRSPVCNLQRHDLAASHERFTSAVISQFRQEFGISSNVCTVTDTDSIKDMNYIHDGMAELSTWDWSFGQTPEFTRTLAHEFPWGTVNVEIRSKHGVIINSRSDVQSSHITSAVYESLDRQLSDLLQGKHYGFLEEGRSTNGADVNEHLSGHELNDLYAWVKRATDIIV